MGNMKCFSIEKDYIENETIEPLITSVYLVQYFRYVNVQVHDELFQILLQLFKTKERLVECKVDT
jgi:hypothetical protein